MEKLENLDREAMARLRPSLTNPSWLVLRRRTAIFEKWLTRIDAQHLDVLDVGGRLQPYRPLLAARLSSYVALDIRKTPKVTIVGRGEQIPLPNDRFDLVLCTQVLEYIADPRQLIAEIHRVLRPGGHLFLSVPAVAPQDSDQDAWRFLPHSLQILLTGFSSVEIVAEGTSISGVFRTLCLATAFFTRPMFLRKPLRLTLVPLLNLTAAFLERSSATSNDSFAANFSACARK